MNKSWNLTNNQYHNYRRFVVDDSVKKFYQFLKSNNITKGKVLDLGCGNGKHTIYFDQQGFNSVGIDFARNAIKLCKDNAVKEKSSAKFKVMDVLDYKFKDKFDIILDCGCLHHIRKQYWRKYLSNLTRSIKKGGYFYLHGFSDKSYVFGNVKKNQPWRVRKGHYTTFFSNRDIKRWFGKDFTLIKAYDFPNSTSSYMLRAYWMRRK
jgi:cyclopropane fatty-acyl-phospholipid synthase-like methyltransferase